MPSSYVMPSLNSTVLFGRKACRFDVVYAWSMQLEHVLLVEA